MEMEDDKRDLISREISKFRDTHKVAYHTAAVTLHFFVSVNKKNLNLFKFFFQNYLKLVYLMEVASPPVSTVDVDFYQWLMSHFYI